MEPHPPLRARSLCWGCWLTPSHRGGEARGLDPPGAGTKAGVPRAPYRKGPVFPVLKLLLGIQASRQTLNPLGASGLQGAVLL